MSKDTKRQRLSASLSFDHCHLCMRTKSAEKHYAVSKNRKVLLANAKTVRIIRDRPSTLRGIEAKNRVCVSVGGVLVSVCL